VAQEHTIVEPGNMASLVYRFRPDPAIEPHEFGILGKMLYQDSEGTQYLSVFHNQTIFLTEAEDDADYGALMINTLVMAAAGVGVWRLVREDGHSIATKSKKELKAEQAAGASGGDSSDWLDGTAGAGQRAKGKKKNAQKKGGR
jgi:hypothetical protein